MSKWFLSGILAMIFLISPVTSRASNLGDPSTVVNFSLSIDFLYTVTPDDFVDSKFNVTEFFKGLLRNRQGAVAETFSVQLEYLNGRTEVLTDGIYSGSKENLDGAKVNITGKTAVDNYDYTFTATLNYEDINNPEVKVIPWDMSTNTYKPVLEFNKRYDEVSDGYIFKGNVASIFTEEFINDNSDVVFGHTRMMTTISGEEHPESLQKSHIEFLHDDEGINNWWVRTTNRDNREDIILRYNDVSGTVNESFEINSGSFSLNIYDKLGIDNIKVKDSRFTCVDGIITGNVTEDVEIPISYTEPTGYRSDIKTYNGVIHLDVIKPLEVTQDSIVYTAPRAGNATVDLSQYVTGGKGVITFQTDNTDVRITGNKLLFEHDIDKIFQITAFDEAGSTVRFELSTYVSNAAKVTYVETEHTDVDTTTTSLMHDLNSILTLNVKADEGYVIIGYEINGEYVYTHPYRHTLAVRDTTIRPLVVPEMTATTAETNFTFDNGNVDIALDTYATGGYGNYTYTIQQPVPGLSIEGSNLKGTLDVSDKVTILISDQSPNTQDVVVILNITVNTVVPVTLSNTIANGEVNGLSNKYRVNDTISLTAVPYEGYRFKYFTINDTPQTKGLTTLSYVLQDATPIEIGAVFEKIPTPKPTLNIYHSEDGTVTLDIKTLVDGSTDDITWSIKEPVSENLSINTEGILTGEIWEDVDIIVIGDTLPQPIEIPIQLKASPYVTVSFKHSEVGTAVLEGINRVGSNVSLTPQPKEGWVFEKWIIEGQEYTSNPLHYRLTKDVNIDVVFSKSLTKTDDAVQVEGSSNNVRIDLNETIEGGKPPYTWRPVTTFPDGLELTPEGILDGEVTEDITLDLIVTDHSQPPIELPISIEIKARKEINLTVTNNENCKVSVQSGVYREGDILEILATPDEDYLFEYWTVNGKQLLSNPLQYTVGSEDITIQAKTTPKPIKEPSEHYITTDEKGHFIFKYSDIVSEHITSYEHKLEGTKGNLIRNAEEGTITGDLLNTGKVTLTINGEDIIVNVSVPMSLVEDATENDMTKYVFGGATPYIFEGEIPEGLKVTGSIIQAINQGAYRFDVTAFDSSTPRNSIKIPMKVTVDELGNVTAEIDKDQEFIVTFVTGIEGVTIEPQKVKNGDVVKEPESIPNPGFILDGWYKDNVKYDFSSTVSSNFTLTAKWLDNEQVDKHTVTIKPSNNTIEVVAGTKIKGLIEPSQEGKNFAGWFLDEQLTVAFDPSKDLVTSDITLWPKFVDIKTHVLSFNVEGVPSQDVQDGSTAIKPSDPTKDNKVFIGWFKDEALTQQWNWETDIVTAPTKLYAKFVDKNLVVRVFDGDKLIQELELEYGDGVKQIGTPKKENHTFDGLYYDKEFTKPFDFDKPATEDLDLYIKFVRSHWTVKYVTSGGSTVGDVTVQVNSTLEKPSDPTRSGYSFIGWYKDESLTKLYDFNSKVTSDITLYAKWEKVDGAITVIFDTNGGSVVYPIAVEKNMTVQKPSDPTKSNHIFLGWYSDKELTKSFDFSTKITSDITLYAKWEKLVFTVKFESNGGTTYNDVTINKDNVVTKPNDPTKEGHTFGGWYIDKELTKAYDFNTKVSSDFTLYAKWNPGTKAPEVQNGNAAVPQTGDNSPFFIEWFLIN